MLVAISIPIFTAQLEKSREGTDLANIRSAYAECSTALLSESSDTATSVVFTAATDSDPAQAVKAGIVIRQQTSGWVSSGEISGLKYGASETGLPSVTNSDTVTVTVKGDGTWTVTKD